MPASRMGRRYTRINNTASQTNPNSPMAYIFGALPGSGGQQGALTPTDGPCYVVVRFD